MAMRGAAYSVKDRQHRALRDAAGGRAARDRHDGRMLYRMELRGWIIFDGDGYYELTDLGREALAEAPEVEALRPESPRFVEVLPGVPAAILLPSGLPAPETDGMAEVCCGALEAAAAAGVLEVTAGATYVRVPGKLWMATFCPFCGARRAPVGSSLGSEG